MVAIVFYSPVVQKIKLYCVLTFKENSGNAKSAPSSARGYERGHICYRLLWGGRTLHTLPGLDDGRTGSFKGQYLAWCHDEEM